MTAPVPTERPGTREMRVRIGETGTSTSEMRARINVVGAPIREIGSRIHQMCVSTDETAV